MKHYNCFNNCNGIFGTTLFFAESEEQINGTPRIQILYINQRMFNGNYKPLNFITIIPANVKILTKKLYF